MRPRLTLLFTNDLHGRLTPALASWLAARKAATSPSLLFDGGDAVACGNVGFHRHGEPAHDLMAAAGYDALALGNREFHFRPWPQACKLSRARCPVLCTNLLAPPGFGGVQAAARFDVAGLTVLVLGALTPMVTATHWARFISPARFGEPEAALRQHLLAAPRAAVTVLLSHLGLAADRRLASARLGLDVILGGHSHTELDEPEMVSGTVVAQNAPYAASVTELKLTLDAAPVAVATSRIWRPPWTTDGWEAP